MQGLTPQVETFLKKEMGVASPEDSLVFKHPARSRKEQAVINFYGKVAEEKRKQNQSVDPMQKIMVGGSSSSLKRAYGSAVPSS